MRRNHRILLPVLALALLGLAACGGAAEPTPDVALIYTQIWETAVAAQTETALAAPPLPTETPTPEASPTLEMTNTPLVSETPAEGVPTMTPLTIVTPASPGQGACDNAAFVDDVTFPDGTEVAPNTTFVKTWRFKNLGPCTWEKDYRLIFSYQSGGTNWNTLQPVAFNKVVAPGDEFDISVTLKAPAAVGDYGGWFRLQNNKGFNFGPEFAVYIKVVK